MAFSALPATAMAPLETQDSANSRAAAFALPLKAKQYRMTSPMGPRCIPVVGGSTFHLGQDMGAKDNEPIYAAAAGTVRSIVSGTSSRTGMIIVNHRIDGATYEFAYMHMWPNDVMVKVGDKVKVGQQIAKVGSSGPATGPHLHFEIWKERFYSADANVVDPVAFLGKRGVDLKASASANYGASNKNCTYYARGKTDVFASASASAKVLARPGRNTEVTSSPGAINGLRNGDFVKVNYGSVSGWMDRFAVTPNKLAEAPAGTLLPSGTVTNGVVIPFASYTNPGLLNIRSGAAAWYSKLTSIPAGSTLTAYESASGWTRVKYKSTEGWVSSSLIRKVADIDPATVNATHELSGNLKLRSGAGYTYKETHALKSGTKVAIRRSIGSWTQVQAGELSGWLRTEDLRKIGSIAPPANALPPATSKPPETVVGEVPTETTHKTTTGLNLRSGPGANTKVVKMLMAGTPVIELKRDGSWSQLKVGSQTGWAHNGYLTVYTAPAKPTPAPTAKPPAKPTTPAVTSLKKKTYATKSKVTLRKSASSKSASIRSISAKKKIVVNAKSGSWVRVSYAGKTGWIPSKYLTTYKAPARTKTTTSGLRLRKAATTSSKTLLVIRKGGKVAVKATKGAWSQVSYSGKTGWVANRYLK